MGTGGPPVTVRAATLAGGEKNQDRYAYGDGWAFVLDGASSFATEQPEHDGGWYAERLKNALVHELTSRPTDATTELVAGAIQVAASAHDNPETCPTSTIALARWSSETVETYVLGDSTATLIGDSGEEELTDSRLAHVAPEIRAEYRSRLAEGRGFDHRHRQLLRRLQSRQARARNRSSGYWIAGAAPDAAYHGMNRIHCLDNVAAAALATDGAVQAFNYGVVATWASFGHEHLLKTLTETQEREAADHQGRRNPRSKRHDDKTLIWIEFPS